MSPKDCCHLSEKYRHFLTDRSAQYILVWYFNQAFVLGQKIGLLRQWRHRPNIHNGFIRYLTTDNPIHIHCRQQSQFSRFPWNVSAHRRSLQWNIVIKCLISNCRALYSRSVVKNS